MYNERLENLIEAALADGELTEKEKQILFKNAQTMGVDLDEFEMVLDAKLFEKKKEIKKEQAVAQPQVSSAPKSNKFGDVRKCPQCGAVVQAMQAVCPECGHNFSGIEANASFSALMRMLDKVESERNDSEVTGLFSASVKMFSDALGIKNKTDNRKKDIIKNYPIPTTKEDLLEFLSMSVPNAKMVGNFFTKKNPEYEAHNEYVPVWKAKCEQVMIKAKMSLKNDKEVMELVNKYAAELGISI